MPRLKRPCDERNNSRCHPRFASAPQKFLQTRGCGNSHKNKIGAMGTRKARMMGGDEWRGGRSWEQSENHAHGRPASTSSELGKSTGECRQHEHILRRGDQEQGANKVTTVKEGESSCAVVEPWPAAPLKDEGPKPKTVGQQVAVGRARVAQKGLGSDIRASDQTSKKMLVMVGAASSCHKEA